MKFEPLSKYLSDQLVDELREKIQKGNFPGIQFEEAMQFILTDGILPKSGLPVDSFLKLEDWIRGTPRP